MPALLKEKKIATLVLVALAGILIGSCLNLLLISLIPGENNVVKTLFTYNVINFGLANPLTIDLYAIKLTFGIQMKFSFLSIVGIFVSLYFFRWYR
jgi:hypothetical protein